MHGGNDPRARGRRPRVLPGPRPPPSARRATSSPTRSLPAGAGTCGRWSRRPKATTWANGSTSTTRTRHAQSIPCSQPTRPPRALRSPRKVNWHENSARRQALRLLLGRPVGPGHGRAGDRASHEFRLPTSASLAHRRRGPARRRVRRDPPGLHGDSRSPEGTPGRGFAPARACRLSWRPCWVARSA